MHTNASMHVKAPITRQLSSCAANRRKIQVPEQAQGSWADPTGWFVLDTLVGCFFAFEVTRERERERERDALYL